MANIYDMSDTWNDGVTTFTAIKMNVTDTASASGSLLMDLQVGGTSKFKIDRAGSAFLSQSSNFAAALNFQTNGSDSLDFIWSGSGLIVRSAGSANIAAFNSNRFELASSIPLTWNVGTNLGGGVSDLILARDAANTLAQRNSTNAQTFNIYNTYTDASNYERASFTQTATGLVLDAQFDGTGLEPDNILELKSGGSSKFKVNKIGELRLTGATVNDSASFGFRTNAFTPEIYLATNSGGGKFFVTANEGSNQGRVALASTVEFGFSSNSNLNSGTTIDVVLRRDAANTLAQRNSTNAQTFNLYNTYTDASNYERGFMKWNSNVLEIGTEAGGTGTGRAVTIKAAGQASFVGSSIFIGRTGWDFIVGTSANQLYFKDTTNIGWGGTTSSFPALKRSTTSLQARLADDSAFTNIQGKLTTETAYTVGAPIATGYIVLYDSTGTAYKVPAEAL